MVRPSLAVTRTAPVALVFFGLLGGSLWWLWAVAGAGHPWLHATVATIMVVVSIVVHELGHAAAAVRMGERWTGVRLTGYGVGVVLQHERRTYAQQAVISAAGPGAVIVWDVLVGVVGLAVWGWSLSPLLVAAGCGLLLNLPNLLLPIDRNDGTKLARGLWACVRGRGHEPWPTVDVDPVGGAAR
ncbi:MAG TPA: M50 family metallopeptidase [Candidatus Luteococcus avicola]|nr:M50 family metallopeptidase [Candidatus Luteococcus avicola]